jgi:hypothetical protein
VEKFSAALVTALGADAVDHPEIFRASKDIIKMGTLIEDYAKEIGAFRGARDRTLPANMEDLTLNMDLTSQEKSKFFLTDSSEIISDLASNSYIKILGLSEADAVEEARKVYPAYMPRKPPGVSDIVVEDIKKSLFNTYPVPWWIRRKADVPDTLPPLFLKLIRHLLPHKTDRKYFYSWLYHSLFERALVYLVLCGNPGTGKNTLKLVMRALHGHSNSIDGKKSTLIEKFNSQFADSTLAWFDELKYDMEMENTMKELQNDSISIERKGVDTTRSTKIYSSIVISNNKPRDNYISFDSRKFAPLVLNTDRLDVSMSSEEIDELVGKVESPDEDTYDIDFIAQIGKWIKRHGKSKQWPNLEYRGPMFYKLAHTSMSQWQKKAANVVMGVNARELSRAVIDPEKGYLWSTVREALYRKNGDKSLAFPDNTSVQYFFDIFLDAKGRKAFTTKSTGDDLSDDFWVKCLFKVELTTEAQVMGSPLMRGGDRGEEKTEREYYDL